MLPPGRPRPLLTLRRCSFHQQFGQRKPRPSCRSLRPGMCHTWHRTTYGDNPHRYKNELIGLPSAEQVSTRQSRTLPCARCVCCFRGGIRLAKMVSANLHHRDLLASASECAVRNAVGLRSERLLDQSCAWNRGYSKLWKFSPCRHGLVITALQPFPQRAAQH